MRAILLGLIRLYQVATAWRPSPCRYQPTCSEYARGAIAAISSGKSNGTLSGFDSYTSRIRGM